MVSWVVIAIIIVAIVIFYKISGFRYDRMWTYFLAIVMVFLLFTFFTVTKRNGADISTFDGFMKGTKIYFGWLGTSVKSIGKITGNVVKGDLPENSSNNTTAEINSKKGWR